MNPNNRYLKGLAEDIFDPTTQWTAENLPVFSDAIVVTHHTLPINTYLNQHIKKIDWIPLDTSVPSSELVLKLLAKYNLTLNFKDIIYKHQSVTEKIDIYNLLKSRIDLNNHVVYNILRVDNDLYSEVCSKINLIGTNWDEISWLKHQ
jgi:hypothetical protein